MESLTKQGFYIEHTGGNCTAWVKKLPNGQFVVITCIGGCTHNFEGSAMVGIYDGSEDEMWGNLITSFELNLDKLFDVRWGAGYAHPDNKTVYMSEITEENGWDIYNIEKIADLQIGQGVDCSDIGGDVFVTRIK
jgi:hypothetical protein